MNRNSSKPHLLWPEVDVISNIVNNNAVQTNEAEVAHTKQLESLTEKGSTRKITSILTMQNQS